MTKARICPICGKEFIPRPNQKYCSPSCKSAHYYRELEARKGAGEKIERLEKEADWLAGKLAEASGSMFDDEMEDIGFQCLHECEQIGCTLDCRKQNWRESARKAVEAQSDNP